LRNAEKRRDNFKPSIAVPSVISEKFNALIKYPNMEHSNLDDDPPPSYFDDASNSKTAVIVEEEKSARIKEIK
jgi:hypothetical protein